MNNTIKLLLFNILLCSAPALQAIGNLRTFGARAFKAASASAVKFKINAQVFKAHKQPFAKPFGFKNGGNQGGYKKYAHTAALMPMIKVGALYGAYDRVKEWLGYGKPFEVDFQTCTVENLHKHPEHIQDFIDYSLKSMHLEEKYLLVALQIIKNKPELMDQFAKQALNLLEQIFSAHQNRGYFGYGTIPHIKRLTVILMESCTSSNQIERLGRLQQVYCTVFSRDFYKTMENLSKATPFMKKLISLIDSDSEILDVLVRPKGESLLDYAYYRADANTKKILEEKMQRLMVKKYGNFVFLSEGAVLNDKMLQLLKGKYPLWAYKLRYVPGHQTQTHLSEYTAAQKQFKDLSPEIQELAIEIQKKEAQERARGNYVFYHGQPWHLHLAADIYKKLWNIAHQDAVDEDFTFLRFNGQKHIKDSRKDSLFLNHALFGHPEFAGSSSIYYFLNNTGVEAPQIDLVYLFKKNKMDQYYIKYKDDINKLVQLHTESRRYGNMLMVSVPKEKLQWVYPTVWFGHCVPVAINGNETDDSKKIIDAFIKKPKSIRQQGHSWYLSYNKGGEGIEYVMPINTQYALDPKNGPRIYSFNAADKEKLKKYTEARDTLFAKIKQDFEQDKAKPRYYMLK